MNESRLKQAASHAQTVASHGKWVKPGKPSWLAVKVVMGFAVEIAARLAVNLTRRVVGLKLCVGLCGACRGIDVM